MEWLTSITTWLLAILVNVWNSTIAFVSDFWVDIADSILSSIASVVVAIPTPSFLNDYSLSSIFSTIPSDILYFVSFLNLPEAFSLVGAGLSFRLLRKVVTLFQW